MHKTRYSYTVLIVDQCVVEEVHASFGSGVAIRDISGGYVVERRLHYYVTYEYDSN